MTNAANGSRLRLGPDVHEEPALKPQTAIGAFRGCVLVFVCVCVRLIFSVVSPTLQSGQLQQRLENVQRDFIIFNRER